MISIIMPVYNGEDFLEEAVRSVQAQTVPDWELLIINDCSTDNSHEIARQLAKQDERIILLNNEQNLGAAGSRNRGIDASRGELIAFLDCDDLWLTEKLEKQLPLLKEADVVYSSYAIVSEGGQLLKEYRVPNRTNINQLLKENVIGCSSVILKREILKKKCFRKEFYHEDYVLWLELLQSGARFCGAEEILLHYRLRSDSKAANKLKSARERWKIYRQFLKLSPWESFCCLLCYAAAGLRKYKGTRCRP